MSRKLKGGMSAIGIILAMGVMALPLSAVAADKGPIKIGYLSTTSGTFAADGEFMRNAVNLYFESINYMVAGRKIEVIHEDDKMDPRTGLVKSKRLVEEREVHMVAGVIPSHIAYAIKGYLVSKKTPFIINNAGAVGLTSYDYSPYVFRSSMSNAQHSHPLGEYLYEKGHRKLVVVTSDYSAGYEHVGGVCRTFTGAGGEIIDEIYAPLGTMDFAPYLSRIDPGKVDSVLGFFGGVDSINFVKQYAQYGLKGKVPLYSLHMVMEHVAPEMGEAAVGVVDCSSYMPALNLTNKEHLDFVSAYKKRYDGKWPNFLAEGAYVGMQLIVKGLQAINGNVEDTGAFIKGMEEADIVAPRGPFRLDQYHNPIQNEYISVFKFQNGEPYLEIIKTYPNVSQFWKWSPEEFMKMPTYPEMKGKWAKK